MRSKIEGIKKVISENSSLVRSRQEHIIFTKFMLEKNRELEEILFMKFGVSGKRNVLGTAVLFLLEELKALKVKTEKDGK